MATIPSLLHPSTHRLFSLRSAAVVAMASLGLGQDIFSRGFRFNPTPLEAATYYLPRLVAGAPLHEAVRPVVHHADVYACEPGDLARRFPPLPKTGHRFFFTHCKLQQPTRAGKASRPARAAGAGSWHSQGGVSDVVDGAGVKVGEARKLRYKKGGAYTDWLMDEFFSTCCSEDAVTGDRQYVFCNMYVSPRAAPNSAAHQESAAFFAPPAPAPVAIVQAAVTKRPAPPQFAEPPCTKRMRGAVAAPTPPFTQPAGYYRTASFAPSPQYAPHTTASAQPPPPPPVPPHLAAPPRPVPTRFAAPPPPLPTRLAAPPPQWPSRSPALAPPQPTKQQMPPPPPLRPCHVAAVQEPARHCLSQATSEKTTKHSHRTLVDLFEAAAELVYEAEEEERVVAPHPKAALDEEEDWDELTQQLSLLPEGEEEIPDAVAAPDPASKDEPPAAVQDDDYDELCHALELELE
ncbi:unnamed protein product [Urochloa decumbens]|uniref:NAC domain-containing protein n=1 Tax=Urochloa decumbens TaxID=240449 RepID=A0ABC9B209_9POAL